MTTRCVFHPGRELAVSVEGKGYCSKCEEGQKAARSLIDAHVKPGACFIVYRGGDTWMPIGGTGCAHFVAHDKNIPALGGVEHCLAGFIVRVPDLIQGRVEIPDTSDVEPGDIYVTANRRHCGIVRFNIPGPGRGRRRIMIEHASSAHHAVLTGDFTVYFRGQGSFFR